MAKRERADLKIEKNSEIPAGYRAEDGRKSVSPGPQRKHDTPEYHDEARTQVLLNGEPVDSVSDFGEVVVDPGGEPVQTGKKR